MASDAAYRKTLLAGLRTHIEDQATLPQGLTETLAGRIVEVFGAALVPVRFRSSSNVEDGLEFSGAGLYDSTTVCAADSADDDTQGPSLCNPAQANERSIERGLRRVWASLYSDRAWAERDWYQVPQSAASMAILVSLGFPDEAANGVAFTGDPADPSDPRYVINAQLGDEKVVSNDPSKVPELVRLELTDGQVSHIARVRSSSLATPGVPVLDDDQLKELGALMATIDALYPLDLGTHARDEVLLDLEFKVQKDTLQLKLKQIRPFLRNLPKE
jgi:phosphoenolpyruvate synthase/pyruvate phosphate dikinase